MVFQLYQGTSFPVYVKNLPLLSSVKPCTHFSIPPILSSASNTAPAPPIRVLTHPGSIQMITALPNFSLTSPLCCTVKAFRAAFEIEYVAHFRGSIDSETTIEPRPEVMFMILAEDDSRPSSSKNCVVLAGPITFTRIFSSRSDGLMESEVCSGTEFIPALLSKKSILPPSRALPASLTNERMESRSPVSQVRIWVDDEATFLRSPRLEDEERTQARILLDSSSDSWRTNSRPRPRLAPGRLLQ